VDGEFAEVKDPRAFRDVLGHFCTGLTVITGQLPDGSRFGLTASSFQALSLEPPLVLYSVRREAASVAMVKAAGGFCVNVLGDTHSDIARRFGSAVEDRFAGMEWHRSPSGSWIVPDAIAVLECRLWKTYEGGDHIIIIGEVTHERRAVGNPLLFFRGEFRPIGPVAAT
jgi:3-hydroxy-9,10-secoandrosta-1,3,5(10)-triene-9,17-dione monooxygenase reductase component